MAAQLAASQEGLSSVHKLVSIKLYSRVSAEKVRNMCVKHEDGLKYLERFITGMVPSI
jgi:hypothetical protein